MTNDTDEWAEERRNVAATIIQGYWRQSRQRKNAKEGAAGRPESAQSNEGPITADDIEKGAILM
jgi:hypothetical protein